MNNENELTAALLTIEKCRELSGSPAGVDLRDWVKQLAAENVQVRERHRFIRALAVSILEHSGGRRDWRGAMEDASDLVKTVDEVYSNTPATDRIVAGIKADAANQMCVAFVKHKELAGLSDDDVVTVREATDAVLHCAEVISEGADK
ncbi:hypothetical protein [Klebsiella aerogenes]|uniref:hypothetical protein n=1 Tax=Klebsiella aerogenes TaxID=548 RepID=UPI0007350A05|nr:hypothetical protein [Klebsiella aerogenes]ELA1945397.1 hypothetical protein [Klebsiella aerogenes]KTI99578.1 hypothetical protein ASU92_12595 [Klebsiella aerogenes]MDU9127139.1 hypothetical protein [Klebsiella aerogenes]HBS0233474.1 hypothetical protein [Klebsiella aerogenes]HBW5536238.1 hypothetical protein [Klebsiella aerogenes]